MVTAEIADQADELPLNSQVDFHEYIQHPTSEGEFVYSVAAVSTSQQLPLKAYDKRDNNIAIMRVTTLSRLMDVVNLISPSSALPRIIADVSSDNHLTLNYHAPSEAGNARNLSYICMDRSVYTDQQQPVQQEANNPNENRKILHTRGI